MENITYKDLKILYEDNHVIVVVKPQNVPSQEDSSKDVDMLTLVKQYVKEKEKKPGNVYVGLVHRLDRPTGGVMVFAKTSKAAERLAEQMKTNEFEKEYYCVCESVPKEKSGKLVHYLKKDEKNNIVKLATMSEDGAKKAILNYEVKEVVKGCALVKVNLETGRSHQIRVQLSSIGCPLVGDVKYGAKENGKINLALWATRLSFIHPTQKDRRTYIVYPPVDDMPWNMFDINRYLNIVKISEPYSFLKQKDEVESILDKN